MSENKSFPDFSGKCISMQLIDETHSHDLNNPRFEYQAGRLFIIGKIPPGATESGWSDNQIGAIAWDRVRNYVLFDDLESYKIAVKISDDYSEKEDASEQKENT